MAAESMRFCARMLQQKRQSCLPGTWHGGRQVLGQTWDESARLCWENVGSVVNLVPPGCALPLPGDQRRPGPNDLHRVAMAGRSGGRLATPRRIAARRFKRCGLPAMLAHSFSDACALVPPIASTCQKTKQTHTQGAGASAHHSHQI